MNRSANVTSIEALRTFKAALQEYQETLADSISSLLVEVQRGINWLEGDRSSYWPVQIRQSNDLFAEARNTLSRKLLTQGDSGHSCYDEKKDVQQAKERVRYCEQRLASVKHWARIVSHDGEEFQGRLSSLSHFVENELPKAIAKLESFATALERYSEKSANTSSARKDPS